MCRCRCWTSTTMSGKVLKTISRSFSNCWTYCIIALAIIIVLGMLIAYLSVRKKSMLTSAIDTIAMFPYIIPGSVLGITLLLAFNGKGDPMLLSKALRKAISRIWSLP